MKRSGIFLGVFILTMTIHYMTLIVLFLIWVAVIGPLCWHLIYFILQSILLLILFNIFVGVLLMNLLISSILMMNLLISTILIMSLLIFTILMIILIFILVLIVVNVYVFFLLLASIRLFKMVFILSSGYKLFLSRMDVLTVQVLLGLHLFLWLIR